MKRQDDKVDGIPKKITYQEALKSLEDDFARKIDIIHKKYPTNTCKRAIATVEMYEHDFNTLYLMLAARDIVHRNTVAINTAQRKLKNKK